MGKEKKEKIDKKEKKDKKDKKDKKEAKRLKEEAEMMQVLKNCQNSMMQAFVEQTVVSQLVEEDFMEAFAASEEYAQALEAFKKRFEMEHGRG